MTLHTLPSGGPQSPVSGLSAFLPPSASPKAFRQAIGDEIERMIAMLDDLDGDDDLEPDLAGTPNQGAACDAEGDDSDLELSGDENEPSLGSLGSCGGLYLRQAQTWAAGDDKDREEEDGNLEPDHENEPSLGSLDRMVNQERWASTHDSLDACSDREHDDCDLEDGGDTEPNGDEQDGPDYREFGQAKHTVTVAPSCGSPLKSQGVLGYIQTGFTEHPQAIALTVDGECLKPDVLSGSTIVAEPVLPKPGELACFWPVGGGRPIVKYLVTSLDYGFPHNPRSEVVLHVHARMINPPRLLGMRADRIERIWRVARVIPAADVVRV